tara:strand:+ start:3577 stop:3936 length:360 start_codon:yes stop_codon:yes gene_type:complete
MIAIIDNGRDYSCHAMYFVETDRPLDELRTALKHMSTCYVLGTSDEITWVADSPTTTLRECMEWEWTNERLVDCYMSPTELTDAGREVPMWALEMAVEADGLVDNVWRWVIAARGGSDE